MITLAASKVELILCSACLAQWWQCDGAAVPLSEVLPLLKDARNAARPPGKRRTRTASDSAVLAAARHAVVELACAAAVYPPEPARQEPARALFVPAARTPPREVDLTDGAQESSLLFRQLLAFQEAAARENH